MFCLLSDCNKFRFLGFLAFLTFFISILTLPYSQVNAAQGDYPFTVRVDQSKPVSQQNIRIASRCRRWATSAFDALPKAHTSAITRVVLDLQPDYYDRALAGGSTIFLNCPLLSGRKNLTATLIHEVGHIVDASVLRGTYSAAPSKFSDGARPVTIDDKSVRFYAMSWKNNDVHSTKRMSAYVSRYAMTDPFEDFAETYTFYVLQGPAFHTLAKKSADLQAKYTFFQQHVFQGKEYRFGTASQAALASYRPWDSTLLPYSLTQFLQNAKA